MRTALFADLGDLATAWKWTSAAIGFVRDPVGTLVNEFGKLITSMLAGGVNLTLHWLFSPSLSPDVTKPWFREVYGKTFGIAIVILGISFAFVVISSAMKGNASMAVKSLVIDVPVAVALMAFSLIFINMVIVISDRVSLYLIEGDTQSELSAALAGTYANVWWTDKSSFILGGLLGIVFLLSALMIVVILLVRNALIFIGVALLPFSFVAYVVPSLRQGVNLTVHTLIAFILAKPAIAMVLVVGMSMMDQKTVGQVTPSVADPYSRANQAFNFSDGGTMIFRNVLVVKSLVFNAAGYSVNYTKPIRGSADSGWYFLVDRNIQVNYLNAANTLYNTPADASGVPNVRLSIAGTTIMLTDPTQCSEKSRYQCKVGEIGEVLDRDSERLFRVVVPTGADTAQLRIDHTTNGEADNLDYYREISLDQEFLDRAIYGTEVGEGYVPPKDELTPEDRASITSEERKFLEQAFGYRISEEGLMEYVGEDEGERCSNQTFGQGGKCVYISYDGSITMNDTGVVIGNLNAPVNSGSSWDWATMMAGLVIFLMAAWSPFAIMRMFPLLESGIAINAAQEYGKSANSRFASVHWEGERVLWLMQMAKERRIFPQNPAFYNQGGRYWSSIGKRWLTGNFNSTPKYEKAVRRAPPLPR